MTIGLFFGSFNPIHIGHLLVATRMRERAKLDEVWFVISPQNPFKINSDLADEKHRLEMAKIAIEKIDYFKVNAIEFDLDKPSYTHITLKKLKEQYPDHQFKLIIGEDNVAKFHEWKEANWIAQHIDILVYSRTLKNDEENENLVNYKMKKVDCGLIDISSTEIRVRIKENKPIDYFVTENVKQYILFHAIYKNE